MYIVTKVAAYWWPVKVALPTQDGQWTTHILDLQFRRYEAEEYEALLAQVRAQKLKDRDFVKLVVLGWRDVVTPDKQAVPFTLAALDAMCTEPGVAACIARDFMSTHQDAAEKNS